MTISMTISMTHYLPRFTTLVCVVFCCTFSLSTPAPALAQVHNQLFTLNGMSADVIWTAGPVAVGGNIYISVEPRNYGSEPLPGFRVRLDATPLGFSEAIDLPDGLVDGIPNNREWFAPSSIFATPGDIVLRLTADGGLGRGGVIELPLRLLPAPDADGDTLPDLWERGVGLSEVSAAGDEGADGDPDGDGVRNRDEFRHRSHPRGFHARYFPEGVTDDFFETEVTPAVLPGLSARMTVRRVDEAGWVTSTVVARNGGDAVAWSHEALRFRPGPFATIIESDAPVVAERTTKWPGHRAGSPVGYGSHGSEGAAALSTRWFFAEGVTGSFHTYISVLNPTTQTATLSVAYLGSDGATQVLRDHTIAPDSRATIDVNADAVGLASTDVAIVIDSSVPIAAERSIYRDAGGRFWGAGTSSIGAPAAATEWLFAEGLTNPAFETYLLLLNPGATTAEVEIDVLRANGEPITLTRTIEPRSRATVHMKSAHPALALESSFGLVVRSVNGAAIVAERTMWWNDPVRGTFWVEGHTSMGALAPATRWFAPANWITGSRGQASVYLLLANPGATPATVHVMPQDQSPGDALVTVPARGRATLDVTAVFSGGLVRPDGRYAPLLVESLGDTPVPVVVERSIYANTDDTIWELGTNMLLTPLPPR